MRSWNTRQLRVFQRYCSLYGVSLTPELVWQLGHRYAAKHARERLQLAA